MFWDKLKKILENREGEKENAENKNQKKKIENLVFFVILLIITIVAINIIWKDQKTTKQEDPEKKLATQTTEKNINNTNMRTSNELETKLENILSKIQGVGEVHVFINYSETSEVVAMYNENTKTSTTEETDTSGGTRKIEQQDSQKDIVYQEENGQKTPITQKVIEPKIEGAIITAKGANNSSVKTNIVQAVEAVTGLATHKIQVFEMK